jgi:MFS family permease
MIITIIVYSVATALCALSFSLWWLILFRFISALGIGGEWAAGASLVLVSVSFFCFCFSPFCIYILRSVSTWKRSSPASSCLHFLPPASSCLLHSPFLPSFCSRAETLPHSKRVMGGALMFTAAPIGAFLGFLVNFVLASLISPDTNEKEDLTWRLVFASALIPVLLTILVRRKVKEPQNWSRSTSSSTSSFSPSSSFFEVFRPPLRTRTLASLFLVLLCLSTWWCISTFVPSFAAYMASTSSSAASSTSSSALKEMTQTYIVWLSISLYAGGLVGALLVIPTTPVLPRLRVFQLYFFTSFFFLLIVYNPFMESREYNILRIIGAFPLGGATQGFFAILAFYVPEQFPTSLR